MVQLCGFIPSIVPYFTNLEKLVNVILDSFVEELTNKALPKSGKELQKLLVNVGLHTLSKTN